MAYEDDFPDVMNTREAQLFLGIHGGSFQRAADEGKIPRYRFGNSWRYRKATLLDMIEQQERETGWRQ